MNGLKETGLFFQKDMPLPLYTVFYVNLAIFAHQKQPILDNWAQNYKDIQIVNMFRELKFQPVLSDRDFLWRMALPSH